MATTTRNGYERPIVADYTSDLLGLVEALQAHLEWQKEADGLGVPMDTREPASPPHSSRTATSPGPTPEVTVASPVLPPLVGPEAAAQAPPAPCLEQLRGRVAGCTQCGLAQTRTKTVFARGNPEARLCFVGEAPGADEDAAGLPFVGRAGQLLDKMIGAMGLSPDRDVYICNILKCRPPENRRPTPSEIECCIPFLHEQLEQVRPRVIVAMGNTAISALLKTQVGITKLRGQWKLYRGTLVMPTYHPSYLLRPSPQQLDAKRQAWEDLQLVMRELGIELPRRREQGPP